MHDFTTRFEGVWKQNKALAWLLVILGTGLALWASYYPQSPGVSIGMLGLVAGIMSLRPEMSIYEKMSWIAILIVFAVLEVRAISRTDKENTVHQTEQNQKFSDIANDVKDSMKASKSQFDDTVGHVEKVLKETQEVAGLSKSNLENITGGNGFAYVIGPTGVPKGTNFAGQIYNDGNAILSNVHVLVGRVTSECGDDCEQVALDATPLQVGSIGPHTHQMLIGSSFDPRPNRDGTTAHYTLRITAQNGDVQEELRFKLADNSQGWVYRVYVTRKMPGESKARVLKKEDWREPPKHP